jgi:hypothetical protein
MYILVIKFFVYFSSSLFLLVHFFCINMVYFSSSCPSLVSQPLLSSSVDEFNYYHYFPIMHCNIYCILVNAYIL